MLSLQIPPTVQMIGQNSVYGFMQWGKTPWQFVKQTFTCFFSLVQLNTEVLCICFPLTIVFEYVFFMQILIQYKENRSFKILQTFFVRLDMVLCIQ